MKDGSYVSEFEQVPELAPSRLQFALLSRGIAYGIGDRPNYLSLSFGRSASLEGRAAISAGQFSGADFDQAHTDFAAHVVRSGGRPLNIFDGNLERFVRRDDLPQFDVIALNGIWSWLSVEVRKGVVDIVRTRLKPSGLLYISYHCKPDWAPIELLLSPQDLVDGDATTTSLSGRVAKSLRFVQRLTEASASHSQESFRVDGIALAVERPKLEHRTRNGLMEQWFPESFAEIAVQFAEAGMEFAASSDLIDNIPEFGLSSRYQALLADIPDIALFEMTRDYLVGRRFRKDIFIKGKRKMTSVEVANKLDAYSFLALIDKAEFTQSMGTPVGVVMLDVAIYGPIWSMLIAAQGEPVSFRTLAEAVATDGISRTRVAEVLFVLTERGDIAPIVKSTPA